MVISVIERDTLSVQRRTVRTKDKPGRSPGIVFAVPDAGRRYCVPHFHQRASRAVIDFLRNSIGVGLLKICARSDGGKNFVWHGYFDSFRWTLALIALVESRPFHGLVLLLPGFETVFPMLGDYLFPALGSLPSGVAICHLSFQHHLALIFITGSSFVRSHSIVCSIHAITCSLDISLEANHMW
jgi:hypothetical protein